jgi:hypothetical protein
MPWDTFFTLLAQIVIGTFALAFCGIAIASFFLRERKP